MLRLNYLSTHSEKGSCVNQTFCLEEKHSSFFLFVSYGLKQKLGGNFKFKSWTFLVMIFERVADENSMAARLFRSHSYFSQ